MTGIKRKVNYRMYPTNHQDLILRSTLEHHRQLYNAALQERIEAYKLVGKSVNYYDQSKELTELRAEVPEYSLYNAQSQHRTLLRLQRTFENFFRRIKKKEKTKFPRFKSFNKFTSFGFNYDNGFKLFDGSVKIAGIRKIKIRGKSTYTGIPKDCQVLLKNNKWYLSVTLDCEPIRTSNHKYVIAADWGTSKLLTLGKISGTNIEYETIDNPRILNQHLDKLQRLQSQRDKLKKSSKFKRQQVSKQIRNLFHKISNIRKDFNHKLSNNLANECSLFITEKLNIKSLTKQTKVKTMNRNILDTAPAQLFSMIRYKVEETGNEYRELDTIKLKPTQRCSNCWKVKPKKLSDRVHECDCGYIIDRDINSVNVMIISQELAKISDMRLEVLAGTITALVRTVHNTCQQLIIRKIKIRKQNLMSKQLSDEKVLMTFQVEQSIRSQANNKAKTTNFNLSGFLRDCVLEFLANNDIIKASATLKKRAVKTAIAKQA